MFSSVLSFRVSGFGTGSFVFRASDLQVYGLGFAGLGFRIRVTDARFWRSVGRQPALDRIVCTTACNVWISSKELRFRYQNMGT